jgi:5-hydroxyisourate hydrolase
MSVSVNVINAVYGRPVVGMSARLDSQIDGVWTEQLRIKTDDKGSFSSWPEWSLTRGFYQLELDLDGYFSSLGITPFYPSITICFRITDPTYEHHIFLLITPFSYVTYQQN